MKWKPNNNRSCTNADNSTCIINNNRNYFDENYTKHVFIYSRRAFQRDTLKWPCMCSIYRFLALFERERTCIYVIESTLTLLSACLPASLFVNQVALFQLCNVLLAKHLYYLIALLLSSLNRRFWSRLRDYFDKFILHRPQFLSLYLQFWWTNKQRNTFTLLN